MPRDATAPPDTPASTRTSQTGPEPAVLQRKLDLLDAPIGSSPDSQEPPRPRPDGGIPAATAAERKAALLDGPTPTPREVSIARAEQIRLHRSQTRRMDCLHTGRK